MYWKLQKQYSTLKQQLKDTKWILIQLLKKLEHKYFARAIPSKYLSLPPVVESVDHILLWVETRHCNKTIQVSSTYLVTERKLAFFTIDRAITDTHEQKEKQQIFVYR